MSNASPTINRKLAVISEGVRTFATLMNAYRECTPDVQEIVNDMISILNDPNSTTVEKSLALDAIVEALFPGLMSDLIAASKSCRKNAETKAIKTAFQKEEASFAARLAQLMDEQQISQAELAELIGVQQPAISMMLRRKCRPQQRTILRLAEALKVEPTDLWVKSCDEQ